MILYKLYKLGSFYFQKINLICYGNVENLKKNLKNLEKKRMLFNASFF